MTATATFAASGLSVESAVRAAVAAVNDPEYPDVSILDLVPSVEDDRGRRSAIG